MAQAAPVSPGAFRPHWRYRARQWAWAGIDLVFPPLCGGCQRPGWRLCPECQPALQRPPRRVCPDCGYPLGRAPDCHVCRDGQHNITPLSGLRSASLYEGPIQNALHRLKYKHDVILADSLARGLALAWQSYRLPAGWVTPVPLARQRLRERGYNQAHLLARALAELTGQPYLPAAAARVRHTPSQVGLPAAARRANVAGAFQADARQVAGRTLILVDDVCTTGATLAACAHALAQAGAVAVWGLTLARARFADGGFRDGSPPRRGRARQYP